MRWRPLARSRRRRIGAVVVALWAAGAPPVAEPLVIDRRRPAGRCGGARARRSGPRARRGRAGRFRSSASPTGWHGSVRPRSAGLCRSDGSRAGSTWCLGPVGSSLLPRRSDRSRSPRTCSSRDGDPTLAAPAAAVVPAVLGRARGLDVGRSLASRRSHSSGSIIRGRSCACASRSPSSSHPAILISSDFVNRSAGRWHKCHESRRAPGSTGAGHRRTSAGTPARRDHAVRIFRPMPFDRRCPRGSACDRRLLVGDFSPRPRRACGRGAPRADTDAEATSRGLRRRPRRHSGLTDEISRHGRRNEPATSGAASSGRWASSSRRDSLDRAARGAPADPRRRRRPDRAADRRDRRGRCRVPGRRPEDDRGPADAEPGRSSTQPTRPRCARRSTRLTSQAFVVADGTYEWVGTTCGLIEAESEATRRLERRAARRGGVPRRHQRHRRPEPDRVRHRRTRVPRRSA